ncbi:hypothetical protein [Cellulomonas palmilytica]|uniref:hypothetical protein n=1 Tax=Cellulomonas palmilytica TaxID=2608402 RepID=UPI001F39E854|nr:hypothetical protein [Cellulomonas palmilytica]UJP39347.1 hypothetical protein F1D97_13530 [Cellulomonas palmilytica]
MRYTTRPLSDRAWLRPPAERTASPFRVTWTGALELLERELVMIDGVDLVIEVDVREQDVRLDGMLRANARADQPAVVVAFESKHGPLLYRSDQYSAPGYWSRSGMQEPWQHNVYAVARTLECLRAVDRYGAAASGEHYRGFRQIGGASAIVTEAPMTDLEAARILVAAVYPDRHAVGLEYDVAHRVVDLDAFVRRARRHTHPDTALPGVAVTFDEVQRAAAFLRGSRS